MVSSVTTTSRILTSGTCTPVLIPGLQNHPMRIQYETSDAVPLCGIETVVPGERDRPQPELAGHPFSLDMHVGRLVAVEALEEESLPPRQRLYRRHNLSAFASRSESRPPRCPGGVKPEIDRAVGDSRGLSLLILDGDRRVRIRRRHGQPLLAQQVQVLAHTPSGLVDAVLDESPHRILDGGLRDMRELAAGQLTVRTRYWQTAHS